MSFLGAQNSIALGVQGLIHIDTGVVGSADYLLAKSLRFRSSASAYLNRTPATATNQKTWTISVWYKAGGIETGFVNANILNAGGDGSSVLISGTGAFGATYNSRLLYREATATLLYWPMVFRDPAAWYHIVFVMDTTQATAANRTKLYVNGVDQGAFTGTAVTQNSNTSVNSAAAHYINTFNGAFYPSDLEYAEVNFVDGQALAPTAFGAFSIYNQWLPIKYTGTYGTNGFYLPFSNTTSTSTLVADSSGNGNNWTPNNISLTAGSTYDSLSDVPALTSTTAANYVVWNPLWQGRTNSPTNGNLDYPASSVGIGTMDLSTGSFYWEITATGGIATVAVYSTSASSSVAVALGFTYGFRFNGTTGAFDFTTNGTTFTNIATGLTSGPYFIYVSTAALTTASLNAGQRPLAYTAPTDFLPLNTFNI